MKRKAQKQYAEKTVKMELVYNGILSYEEKLMLPTKISPIQLITLAVTEIGLKTDYFFGLSIFLLRW